MRHCGLWMWIAGKKTEPLGSWAAAGGGVRFHWNACEMRWNYFERPIRRDHRMIEALRSSSVRAQSYERRRACRHARVTDDCSRNPQGRDGLLALLSAEVESLALWPEVAQGRTCSVPEQPGNLRHGVPIAMVVKQLALH